MRNKFENITILHSSNRFHFSFNYFNFRMRVCLLPHRSKFRSVPRHAKILKQSLNVPNINSQIELKLNFSFLTECAAGWREFSPGTSKAKTEIQKKNFFHRSINFMFVFCAMYFPWHYCFCCSGGEKSSVCPGECESSESSIELVRFRNHITILTPKAVARF